MTAESVLSGSGSNFMLLYMPCFLRTCVASSCIPGKIGICLSVYISRTLKLKLFGC